jgi:hypothetical protein
MPKCWETKYDTLLQMVNVQNFDAKIYQHVIKWQKAMRLIQYCCMLVATLKSQRGRGRVRVRDSTKQEMGGKRSNASMGVNSKRKKDCTAVIQCCNYLFSEYV